LGGFFRSQLPRMERLGGSNTGAHRHNRPFLSRLEGLRGRTPSPIHLPAHLVQVGSIYMFGLAFFCSSGGSLRSRADPNVEFLLYCPHLINIKITMKHPFPCHLHPFLFHEIILKGMGIVIHQPKNIRPVDRIPQEILDMKLG